MDYLHILDDLTSNFDASLLNTYMKRVHKHLSKNFSQQTRSDRLSNFTCYKPDEKRYSSKCTGKGILGKPCIKAFLYFSLFQVYPEMQNLFPEFRGQGSVEKLETTKFLNGHSRRLMTAVENSVSSLNDFESCSTYLQELGRRHKIRKLKPHYLEVSSSILRSCSRSSLQTYIFCLFKLSRNFTTVYHTFPHINNQSMFIFFKIITIANRESSNYKCKKHIVTHNENDRKYLEID